MISAPTNPVSINCVGTGVLDRPLTQQNLRTVREAGPYVHRDVLCEIKNPTNPNLSRGSLIGILMIGVLTLTFYL